MACLSCQPPNLPMSILRYILAIVLPWAEIRGENNILNVYVRPHEQPLAMIHRISGLAHPAPCMTRHVHTRPTLMVFALAFPCPAYQRPPVTILHLLAAAASGTHHAAFRNSARWVSPPLITGTLPLSRAVRLDRRRPAFALDYGRSCRVSRASKDLIPFSPLLFYYDCVRVRHPPFVIYLPAFAFSVYRLACGCCMTVLCIVPVSWLASHMLRCCCYWHYVNYYQTRGQSDIKTCLLAI